VVADLFEGHDANVAVIIHCAAQPAHDWAAKAPLVDFSVNAGGTLDLGFQIIYSAFLVGILESALPAPPKGRYRTARPKRLSQQISQAFAEALEILNPRASVKSF
jgi:hypothetical protein